MNPHLALASRLALRARRALILALLLALPGSAVAAPWSVSRLAQFATRNNGTRAKSLSKDLLKPWDARYAKIGRTASSTLRSATPDRYALRVYLLERELVDMLQHVDRSDKLTTRQREVVSNDIIARLNQLQHSYTTIQTTMAANLGLNMTATGGIAVECVRDAKGRRDLYEPAKGKRYADVRAKREAQHPGQEPYFCLNRETIGGVKSGELLEGAAMPGGQLRVTRFAKHLDVAGGKSVPAAFGTKIFFSERSKARKAILAYGSNWSGTYQPNMAALGDTLLPRFDKLGIDRSKVVLTPSMPLSTKMYENLLEARGVAKPKVKGMGARLEQLADVRAGHLERAWDQAILKHAR